MKIFTVLLFLPFLAFAEDVNSIVKKANHQSYYQGQDGRAKVVMKIKDSQGRERKRSFYILRKDLEDSTDGKQTFYVHFKRPKDVNKMSFLVKKNITGEDDRWMYFPSLDLVKRIAGSDKRTSFVGSDFYYEDISGRGIIADTHTLLETTKTSYIVKSVPKDSSLDFKHYITTINKTSMLPMKTEYFDSNNKIFRVYESLAIKTIDGHPTVTESRMRDLNKMSETVITYRKVQYNVGLEDNLFSERSLRTPPKKEMKF